MITVKDVRHYRFLDQTIRKIEKELDRLRENDCLSDKVSGSSDCFPYQERHFTIGTHTNKKEITVAEQELERLIFVKFEIDNLFRSLTNPRDKILFQMTMEGRTQSEIADVLHIERSTASKRLKSILEGG